MTADAMPRLDIDGLRAKIEALVVSATVCDLEARPLHQTPAGTHYVSFGHGERRAEGAEPSLGAKYAPQDTLQDRTFEAVKAYRNEFPGAVTLTWRTPPQREPGPFGDPNVYLRLAFEPVAA